MIISSSPGSVLFALIELVFSSFSAYFAMSFGVGNCPEVVAALEALAKAVTEKTAIKNNFFMFFSLKIGHRLGCSRLKSNVFGQQTINDY